MADIQSKIDNPKSAIPKLDPKTDGSTVNIVEQNIEMLRELIPDAFTEGSSEDGPRWRIDLDALREILGDYVEDQNERYCFTWNGKSLARQIAQTPSTATLRPCPQESVNWEMTQNLFIEGDNLEVLKLLQKSYHRKVKMIYIDPPYNTGKEFVYPDKFQDNLATYLRYTGQTDEEGFKLSANSEVSGRYHTNWLNMMYPRLKLARNLLIDSGVMFVSIGQDEVSNLIHLCNELFGEENLISICSRVVKTGGQKGIHFSPCVDYILAYAKNVGDLEKFREPISQNLIDKVYTSTEADGPRKGERYRQMGLYQAMLDVRANQRFYIKCPDGTLVIPPGESFPEMRAEGEKVTPGDGDGVWRWTYGRYAKEKAAGNIEFIQSDKTSLVTPDGRQAGWNVYYKIWLNDRLEEGQLPGNILTKFESRHASAELKRLEIPFDFPKPSALLKFLMEVSGVQNGDVVLDFFAGSCPLGHAAMELSMERGSSIPFICVQLPELTADTSEERKAGYTTIAEIGKARLRRVIRMLQTIGENAANAVDRQLPGMREKPVPADLGFKVFKLSASNIKPWDADFDNVKEALLDAVENIKPDRSEADVLYELLLKYGLDLAVPIEERKIDGKTVYIIGAGALIVCLADKVSLDVVEGIAKLKTELKPEVMRVVFKDAGFKDDVVKTNAVQILRQAGIEDVKSL